MGSSVMTLCLRSRMRSILILMFGALILASTARARGGPVVSQVDLPPQFAEGPGARAKLNGYTYPTENNDITLRFDSSLPLWAQVHTRDLWAEIHGPLRAILGPPSANITVTVGYDSLRSASYYLLDVNCIMMSLLPAGYNQTFYDGQFTHEMVHAFQDAALERGGDGWSTEGIAVSATAIVAEAVSSTRWLNSTSRSLGELSVTYDNISQMGAAAIGGMDFLAANVSPLHSYVAAGGLWWLLIAAESEAHAGAWTEYTYLARFCQRLYADRLSLASEDVLNTIEATATRPVDGRPARSWVADQPVTVTRVPAGNYIFAMLSNPFLFSDWTTFLFMQPFSRKSDGDVVRLFGHETVRVRAWNMAGRVPCWDIQVQPQNIGLEYQVVPLPDSLRARPGAYLIEVDASDYGAGKLLLTTVAVPEAHYLDNAAAKGTAATFYLPTARDLVDPPFNLAGAALTGSWAGVHVFTPGELSRVPASFDVVVPSSSSPLVLTRTEPLPFLRVLRLDLPGSEADHGVSPVLAAPADSAVGLPRTVELAWRRSARATVYGLQVARDLEFSSLDVDLRDLTDTTCTVGPLQGHRRYWWRVNGPNDRSVGEWSPIRSFVILSIAAAIVRPGDTNNDGMVDARDIMAIGVSWGRTGPARPDGSLAWADSGQVVPTAWDRPVACYADCDGNGRVEAADVAGVIENWGCRFGSPPPLVDRAAACLELLRAIDAAGPTEALRQVQGVVAEYLRSRLGIQLHFVIEPASPNPFRDTITLRFMLPEAVAQATLVVYNAQGSLVAHSLLRGAEAGVESMIWDGRDIHGARAPSGVYFYRFAAGPYRAAGRMILVR